MRTIDRAEYRRLYKEGAIQSVLNPEACSVNDELVLVALDTDRVLRCRIHRGAGA